MSVHDPSFAALLDHFERCTVIIGPDLRVMHFNKLAATSHRLRHGAELVEGAAYFDIVPSDQNKSFLRNFMAALKWLRPSWFFCAQSRALSDSVRALSVRQWKCSPQPCG
jgi:hypothetical protein